MKGINSKSDVEAKLSFVKFLQDNGYNDAQIISTPCDISAEKDGEKWFFEIKMTNRADTYFGAATMTEWEQAFKSPNTFRFVIAIKNSVTDGGFDFILLTPEEMIKYSTIPPFKVYFNIDLNKLRTGEETIKPKRNNRKKKALRLTESVFNTLLSAFREVDNEG